MKEKYQAKAQLMEELQRLRRRVKELEDRHTGRRFDTEPAWNTYAVLQAIIEGTPDPVFLKDRQGYYQVTNTAAARALGKESPKAIIGRADAELIPLEQARQLRENDCRIMDSGTSVEYEESVGDRVYMTMKTPYRDERDQVVGLIGVARDITEAKRAEEELRRLNADLERSNEELEQFAYVASHDLQEPLRMVSSYTQLLAQRYEGYLDGKAKKYIDYAVDGAVRMQRLINDLLAYSRIGTRGRRPEPIDSHALLGETLRNLAVAIEEQRAIITNDDLPTVRADGRQLLQLFQNLIGNGIKFCGEEIPRIHVSARDAGREWLFSIKDNGIGIDPRYRDRVFLIFQRLHTRQEYPGTGIGLALCKRIVERHRGRIWFESQPGQGSVFFFTLPKRKGG